MDLDDHLGARDDLDPRARGEIAALGAGRPAADPGGVRAAWAAKAGVPRAGFRGVERLIRSDVGRRDEISVRLKPDGQVVMVQRWRLAERYDRRKI